MPLTTNAQKVINNIKGLQQGDIIILRDALFRDYSRKFRAFLACIFATKIAWVNATYGNSFVDGTGAAIPVGHPVRTIFTANGITSFTQADADSLVEGLFKTIGNRNVLFGMKKGNTTLANSTALFNPPTQAS